MDDLEIGDEVIVTYSFCEYVGKRGVFVGRRANGARSYQIYMYGGVCALDIRNDCIYNGNDPKYKGKYIVKFMNRSSFEILRKKQ